MLRQLMSKIIANRYAAVCTGCLLLLTQAGGSAVQAEDKPAAKTHAEVECRRATGPIKIDGKADDEAWKHAQEIDTFGAFWAQRPAKTATKARLLWDDKYLYFYAEMEDHDLYADITEHDGVTWDNDVFELFFKTNPEKLGYYEFQVTPANTQMDMYLGSRGSGGFRRWGKARKFEWETAVSLRGKLNQMDDDAPKSEGWSVEGRFPWQDFAPSGGRPKVDASWRFALCRYDYSKEYESPDLSSSAPLTQVNFHRYEDYGVLRFVGEK